MLEAIERCVAVASPARVAEVVCELVAVAITESSPMELVEHIADVELTEETAEDLGVACVAAARVEPRITARRAAFRVRALRRASAAAVDVRSINGDRA
jgi:hypothetical protein